MHVLWTAIAIHFIADFALQSQWMSMEKGKSWEILAYHCLVYASLFLLLSCTPIQAGILFATHFAIDALKARYGIIEKIWQDQLLHLIVIVLLFI